MISFGHRLQHHAERGASSTEYALLAVLIAVFIIGAVTALGGSVNDMFQNSCVSIALAQSETC